MYDLFSPDCHCLPKLKQSDSFICCVPIFSQICDFKEIKLKILTLHLKNSFS